MNGACDDLAVVGAHAVRSVKPGHDYYKQNPLGSLKLDNIFLAHYLKFFSHKSTGIRPVLVRTLRNGSKH